MSNESPIDCGGISYKIQPDARTIEEVRRECRQHILALREKEKELTQLRARVKELEEESKRGMAWADRVEKLRLETANNLTKSIENNNEQEVTIALLRLTVNQLKARIRELEEAMIEVKEKLLEPGWPEDKDLPGIADCIEKVMKR